MRPDKRNGLAVSRPASQHVETCAFWQGQLIQDIHANQDIISCERYFGLDAAAFNPTVFALNASSRAEGVAQQNQAIGKRFAGIQKGQLVASGY